MKAEFWTDAWEQGNIGFHNSEAHDMLQAHLGRLTLPPNPRVFIPLCGKTVDIDWLLAQGCEVVGVELVESAVKEVFVRMGVTPDISVIGDLKKYSAHNLCLYVGDFFDLTQGTTGSIDAVFDRAALIALPDYMRAEYAAHLRALSAGAPQLLITFEYNQGQRAGPPFSVTGEMISKLYAPHYAAKLLQSQDMKDFFNLDKAVECAWHLS